MSSARAAPAELPPAYYLPLGDGLFEPTEATMSPWDHAAQHGGPPTALLATCLDDAFGRPALRVARIGVDFLGPMPRTTVRVETRLIRPGRRTQLSEASHVGGRPGGGGRAGVAPGGDVGRRRLARRGRRRVAGRLGAGGSSVVDLPGDLPGPQPQRFFGDDSWGYGRAAEWRAVSGGFGHTSGSADVWTRLRVPLIDGRPLDGLARFAVMADSANGLSAPKSMRDWWFIPPGVTMHLHRYPVGEWVRLTATSNPGHDGIGLTEGTLADALGRCGTVSQPLLVAPR